MRMLFFYYSNYFYSYSIELARIAITMLISIDFSFYGLFNK